MAKRCSLWSGLAFACAAFWVGVIWLFIVHPGVVVRLFIGLGMLACAGMFWRQADSWQARVVSAILSVLVGGVALDILGVL